MKAEERKELKQNTLVATLEKAGTAIKQGPSRRTVVVGGIALLVVLLLVIYKIIASYTLSLNSERWKVLFSATGTEELRGTDLVSKNAESVQGLAARMQIARQDLIDGRGEGGDPEDRKGVLTNWDNGVKLLTSAGESFKKLAKEYRNSTIDAQLCLFSAAEAYESMGDFDEAIKLYEQASQTGKDNNKPGSLGALAAKAAKRIKDERPLLEELVKELKNRKVN